MTFGEAIEALKQGKRVSRSGWNGKGMHLWMLPAFRVPKDWCKEEHLKHLAEKDGYIDCLPSIRMLTADKKVLTGWLASQTDIFAEDWEIVV
jgi:AMMECR1 domain-containing protein